MKACFFLFIAEVLNLHENAIEEIEPEDFQRLARNHSNSLSKKKKNE